MGIYRYVEGEIVNTSTNMELSANDGDYQFIAQQKNQWQGQEEGIYEGNYKPKDKNDSLSNGINVYLNLFIDGTQNNKTNTEARLANSKEYEEQGNHDDDSYENDYTNVARGYDAVDPNAENQVVVYIEGMGTDDLESDSIVKGVAMGMGDTGVPAKVAKGCKKSAEKIYLKIGKKEVDYLYVNVYGFSRGAAAARHFIHVASSPANYIYQRNEGDNKLYFIKGEFQPDFKLALKDTSFIDTYGYFGACLLEKKLRIKKIIFNFVGIYDTVASYGVYHGNDVSDLNLDSVQKAKFVFHLASDNEYRENFDLTNINSAGLKGLQLILPGVHCDIGGAYLNDVEEVSVVDNVISSHNPYDKQKTKERKDPQYNKFKKILVDEGWYKDPQLVSEFFEDKKYKPKLPFYKNDYNYGLVGKRMLYNTYAKIPLEMMIEKSKNEELGNVKYLTNKLTDYKIKDPFIKEIQLQLNAYYNAIARLRNKHIGAYSENHKNYTAHSNAYIEEIQDIHYSQYVDFDDLQRLRNKYLHWSVKSNLFGLSARDEGPLPVHKRKREIHHG